MKITGTKLGVNFSSWDLHGCLNVTYVYSGSMEMLEFGALIVTITKNRNQGLLYSCSVNNLRIEGASIANLYYIFLRKGITFGSKLEKS